MKKDNRKTNTANVLLRGEELRSMRRKDLARWKRRASRKLMTQKYTPVSENMVEAGWQQTWNDAIDLALKTINAQWKNI